MHRSIYDPRPVPDHLRKNNWGPAPISEKSVGGQVYKKSTEVLMEEIKTGHRKYALNAREQPGVNLYFFLSAGGAPGFAGQ